MHPDPKPFRVQDTSPASTDYPSDRGAAFILVAVLHFVCCGLLLLLLSGVSLAFLARFWPIAAGGLAVLGVVGFAWHVKRGCATCPRDEGVAPLARGRDQLG